MRARYFTVQVGLAAGFLASTSASADRTRRVSVISPLFRSRIRTATAGCCRKSRSGFLGAFKTRPIRLSTGLHGTENEQTEQSQKQTPPIARTGFGDGMFGERREQHTY